MNQMISLPIGGYHFPSQETRHHVSGQQNSFAVGGRPGDYFRNDDAVNHDGEPVYALHDQPNVGAGVPHQQTAGASYSHEHLLSNTGAPSADYGAPTTSSLSVLANYSGLATTPLPTPTGIPAHYSSAPQTYALSGGYAQPFNAPPTMRMSLAEQQSSSEILQSGRSYGLTNPISPSTHDPSRRNNYTTSIPDRSSHMHSPRQRRHEMAVPKTPSYNLADQTPRTVYSPMSMSPQQSTLYSSAYGTGMTTSDNSTNIPPFTEQRTFCELWGGLENIRKKVSPALNCRIEKGFFKSQSDGCYTCYRRNYFSVSCDYSLSPLLIDEPLYVTRDSQTFQVQALAMCLSAAVDGPNGKKIDLVQYTPKRDHGDKSDVTMRKVLPMPAGGARAGHGDTYPFGYHHGILPGQRGPLLPLQQLGSDVEPGQAPGQSSSSNCSATFERVQFKSATANNGKRRAQQQYYHITVELWADIRKSSKDVDTWVKIAQRTSEPVVVRGRSPSHYKNEGTHSSGDFRGAGGASGSGSGLGNYTYTSANSGSSRDYGISGSGGGHTSLGGSYRLSSGIEQPSIDLSPSSSTSSLTTSPADGISMSTGLGLGHAQFGQPLQRSSTYEYFPGPLASTYDGTYAKSESDLTRPVKSETYGTLDGSNTTLPNTCSRYVKPALPSSRGYYSRIANGY